MAVVASLAVLPEPLDGLQGFAFSLRHPPPNQEHAHGTESRIDEEGKAVMKSFHELGVLIHHGEGLGDDEVGQP